MFALWLRESVLLLLAAGCLLGLVEPHGPGQGAFMRRLCFTQVDRWVIKNWTFPDISRFGKVIPVRKEVLKVKNQ